MPLKRNAEGGRSEQSGSRSRMYRSSYYQNGVFTQPELTVQDMRRLVDGILKQEMKWWQPLRWLAVRQIPTLVRWKA